MFGLFRKRKPEAPIRLFNTASRKLEEFVPLRRGEVTMYACGPTVYDHIHIGNLRATLLPDLLTRLFIHHGYKVRSTMNLTDFGHLTDDADAGEDKMMKGMRRDGFAITLANMLVFAETYIDSFKQDNLDFGNLPPSSYTRASDYVKEQIKLVEVLEQKGYTYRISDGVYFDISKFPTYGRLGNVDLEKLKAGARVAINEEKHHPADFALWKNAPMGWDSRWGKGFPGWHIECVAMAFSTLGKQIDIHTGGEDLKYTHHNGEIAEAESVTGKQYVKYWLHNAFVTIDQQKIAKSLGNGLRLRHLADRGFSPADYRYFLLQAHYRAPANFSFTALEAAQNTLLRLRRLVYQELGQVKSGRVSPAYEERFLAALSNDLDTPAALGVLWEVARDSKVSPEDKLATLRLFDSLLALGLSKSVEEGQAELGMAALSSLPEAVASLVKERETARANKDFAAADRLRDEILEQGYLVKDTARGQEVSLK